MILNLQRKYCHRLHRLWPRRRDSYCERDGKRIQGRQISSVAPKLQSLHRSLCQGMNIELMLSLPSRVKTDRWLSRLCWQYLCGKPIPSWINRLAYISTCVPFLERCLPKEFLIPVALEESIREQVNNDSTNEQVIQNKL